MATISNQAEKCLLEIDEELKKKKKLRRGMSKQLIRPLDTQGSPADLAGRRDIGELLTTPPQLNNNSYIIVVIIKYFVEDIEGLKVFLRFVLALGVKSFFSGIYKSPK